MNLGLVSVGNFGSTLPSFAPALILVAAVPVFAALLGGLFVRRESPFGEYLVFALYFQSALLLALVGFAVLPIPDPADDYLKIIYFIGYVATAAHRLWEPHFLKAVAKAGLSFVLYAVAIVLAFGGATFLEGLIG